MIDPNDVLTASPVVSESEDCWSIVAGDLLVPLGDVIGIRVRAEHLGSPFVALMIEIPSGIRPHFKLVDLVIGEQSVMAPPYSLDPDGLRFGQWVEFSDRVLGDVTLAVMCVGRSRPGGGTSARGAEQKRFRGTIWLRDGDGRLWGETVGWVGPRGAEEFSAWCSR